MSPNLIAPQEKHLKIVKEAQFAFSNIQKARTMLNSCSAALENADDES